MRERVREKGKRAGSERAAARSRRGESGEKRRREGWYGGSMVRKRWTAKMEGDETRGRGRARASRCSRLHSRCVDAGIRMRCPAYTRGDIRRARPTGCVCFMPPRYLRREAPALALSFTLRSARVFSRMIYDARSARAEYHGRSLALEYTRRAAARRWTRSSAARERAGRTTFT